MSFHVTCGFKVGLEMKSQFDSSTLCVLNEVNLFLMYSKYVVFDRSMDVGLLPKTYCYAEVWYLQEPVHS